MSLGRTAFSGGVLFTVYERVAAVLMTAKIVYKASVQQSVGSSGNSEGRIDSEYPILYVPSSR